MEAAVWALAFTLLPWPERQKAEVWAGLQDGRGARRCPAQRRDLERPGPRMPRLREEAAARGARLVLPGEAEADRLLGPLPYPVALWVRGTLPPPGPAWPWWAAARAAGRPWSRTRRWARDLTAAGVAVLSGLARGIDGAAHEGALEAGATWGIMGSGLDHPYPPEHVGLMDRIVAAGGGVLTPFRPGPAPQMALPPAEPDPGRLDAGCGCDGSPLCLGLPGHRQAGPGPGEGALGLPRTARGSSRGRA